MVIVERLHTVFEFKEAPVLIENKEYGFSIKQVKPTNHALTLVFTDGLSQFLQPVSERSKAYERIELYFCLPDYWDLSKLPWPVEWLNRIAMVPQKNKTWLGPGDTLPAGKPAQEIDSKLKTNHFILSAPLFLEKTFSTIENPEPTIRFLAVIPIFQKEFEYKEQNSGTLLLDRLKRKNVTEEIDLFRPPVARRRFMGMF